MQMILPPNEAERNKQIIRDAEKTLREVERAAAEAISG